MGTNQDLHVLALQELFLYTRDLQPFYDHIITIPSQFDEVFFSIGAPELLNQSEQYDIKTIMCTIDYYMF